MFATNGVSAVDLDLVVVLFCTEIARVGESKRIYQIDYLPEEQLLVVICGKQHHVRLVPVRALDGDDVEWVKVADTKACISFTTGILRQGHGTQAAVYCLCVAVKRQVRRQTTATSLYYLDQETRREFCNDKAFLLLAYRCSCLRSLGPRPVTSD